MGQMASISCEIFWPPGTGIVIIARYRPNLQTSKVLFSFLTWRNYYFEIYNRKKKYVGFRMEDQRVWSPQTMAICCARSCKF